MKNYKVPKGYELTQVIQPNQIGIAKSHNRNRMCI